MNGLKFHNLLALAFVLSFQLLLVGLTWSHFVYVQANTYLVILLKITFPQTFEIPSFTAQPSGVYWPTNYSHLSSSNSDLCLFHPAILLLCTWAHFQHHKPESALIQRSKVNIKVTLHNFLYLKDHPGTTIKVTQVPLYGHKCNQN